MSYGSIISCILAKVNTRPEKPVLVIINEFNHTLPEQRRSKSNQSLKRICRTQQRVRYFVELTK